MKNGLSRVAALATICYGVALAGGVAAAPCGRPDVDLTFPPNQAENVPTNAVLSAHYAAPALYNDEPVDVTDADGNAVAVTATFDAADSTLRATPSQELVSGHLQIVWPALRGVSGSGGVGRGSMTSVLVGSAADEAPPSFSGLTGIDWDLSRERDPCLDKLEDRFVFKLQVGAAADDLATDLLSLTIFQTRDPSAPEQTGPSELGVRALPADSSIEVRRPTTQAGDTCFAAVVQDLVGNVSGGGEREVCIKTKKPPFFAGCAVGSAALGAGPTPSGSVFSLWLLGLVFLRRGRLGRQPLRAV